MDLLVLRHGIIYGHRRLYVLLCVWGGAFFGRIWWVGFVRMRRMRAGDVFIERSRYLRAVFAGALSTKHWLFGVPCMRSRKLLGYKIS